MRDYPQNVIAVNHVEPVPRRVRAVLAGRTVVDTSRARYVWEHPYYPQYYVPLADVADGTLVDEGTAEETPRGTCGISAWRERASDGHAPPRCSPPPRSRASTTPSASSGPRSTPGSRRTSASSSIHGALHARSTRIRSTRTPARGVQGRRARRVLLARHVLRDRPPDPLRPEPDRRRLHPPRPVGDGHVLPLQGHHERVLVGAASTAGSIPTSPGPTASPLARCSPSRA